MKRAGLPSILALAALNLSALAASPLAPAAGLHILQFGAPSITAQPQNQTVIAGQSATFTVTVTGDGPLSYHWTLNGANVGSSSSAYARSNCQPADCGGLVRVIVSNGSGSVQSSPAILNVATNMALGMSYTLDPAPNYPLCTDPGDATQLTDGQYVQGSGLLWTQMGCVGWHRTWEDTTPISITLDLGEIQPISGLSYNTAAGASGVKWPSAILAMVSENSNSWHFAGDLITLSLTNSFPTTSSYTIHRFLTTDLAARGRYVKLLVFADGDYDQYSFVDEIEIYRGPDAYLTNSVLAPNINDLQGFVTQMRPDVLLRHRLMCDLLAVSDELDSGALPSDASGPLRTELSSIAQQLPFAEVESNNTFTTVFPINDLHRRIFAVQAGVWRASGLGGIIVSQSNRWDMLSPTGTLIPGNATINVDMLSNEYRSDTFNLSNAGTNTASVGIVVGGLPGGTNPPYVSVYEVPFSDTQYGVPVAAALLNIQASDGAYWLQIPAGLTRQIWLTFHPTNVPAGDYSAQIVLNGDSASNQLVSVRLKIHPFTFPDTPTLHLGGWDYTDHDGPYYGLTATNRQPLINLLHKYFVDSPWADSVFLGVGNYDQDGRMTQGPDSTAFSAWLERWPNATSYYVFVDVPRNFGSDGSFAGFAMGTVEFQQALSDWINWWVAQLTQRNLQPSQLTLLLVDEPHTASQDNMVIQYAKVISLAQPRVAIFEDPAWQDPSQATPGLFAACSVLCPTLQMWNTSQTFANFYLSQKEVGRQLRFYSCSGSARALDPYVYYRLQQWSAWEYGALGSDFWSFIDSGGSSSWNEYAIRNGTQAHTPLFLDSASVASGKHMEAIREGIEDFEYLRMLRDRVQTVESYGVTNNATTSARALLSSVADRVLAGTSSKLLWMTPKDRTVADAVRVEILNALDQLQPY
jgi:hypothetical protein